jgi:hypothetical protein
MGNFPNSAFTLPKGKVYIEQAPFTLVAADRHTPAAYAWPFLVRYGVTDNVEFRFIDTGLTSVFGSQGTTGFSPLIFDLKVHLWDQQGKFIPASSLETYIVSTWGSPAFQGGTQPSVNMNFDLKLTEKTGLEWSLGYTGVLDAIDLRTGARFTPRLNFVNSFFQRHNLDTNQFTAQWAIQRQIKKRLAVFAHGYYAGAIFLQQGKGSVAGIGAFWTFSKRLVAFGSCNAGLDPNVSPVSGQFGFSFAL